MATLLAHSVIDNAKIETRKVFICNKQLYILKVYNNKTINMKMYINAFNVTICM